MRSTAPMAELLQRLVDRKQAVRSLIVDCGGEEGWTEVEARRYRLQVVYRDATYWDYRMPHAGRGVGMARAATARRSKVK